ncbi:hypothetical protein Trydic_g23913 [Trypoxylus dichotomus]
MGDLVLWRQASTVASEKGVNGKLRNKYNGSYKVTAVLGNDRYQITTIKAVRGYKNFTAVVSADSLRCYISVATTDGLGDGDAESSGEAMDHQDLIDLLEG